MKIQEMTDEAFASYLAGFTDGEGYIGVQPDLPVRIVIANCEPQVLYDIRDRLGYGSIRSQKVRENWRRRYVLTIGGYDKCLHFIDLVMPYLQIKRVKAEQLVARYERRVSEAYARAERNAAIRAAYQTDELRKDIAARFGVSTSFVTNLMRGHYRPADHMSKVARRRGRDERGLFLPFHPQTSGAQE